MFMHRAIQLYKDISDMKSAKDLEGHVLLGHNHEIVQNPLRKQQGHVKCAYLRITYRAIVKKDQV